MDVQVSVVRQTLWLRNKSFNWIFSSLYNFKQYICTVIQPGTLNLGSNPILYSRNPSWSTWLKGNLHKIKNLQSYHLEWFASYFTYPSWEWPMPWLTSIVFLNCKKVWFLPRFDFFSREFWQLEVRWVIMDEVPCLLGDTLLVYCNIYT